jgi:argininosuccinate synthase
LFARLSPLPTLNPPQGNVVVVGRKSPYSLYDPVIASFEDDQGLYNQADAGGFIKLQALRLRTLGVNRNK